MIIRIISIISIHNWLGKFSVSVVVKCNCHAMNFYATREYIFPCQCLIVRRRIIWKGKHYIFAIEEQICSLSFPNSHLAIRIYLFINIIFAIRMISWGCKLNKCSLSWKTFFLADDDMLSAIRGKKMD